MASRMFIFIYSLLEKVCHAEHLFIELLHENTFGPYPKISCGNKSDRFLLVSKCFRNGSAIPSGTYNPQLWLNAALTLVPSD